MREYALIYLWIMPAGIVWAAILGEPGAAVFVFAIWLVLLLIYRRYYRRPRS
jgi:hypothetical protein